MAEQHRESGDVEAQALFVSAVPYAFYSQMTGDLQASGKDNGCADDVE